MDAACPEGRECFTDGYGEYFINDDGLTEYTTPVVINSPDCGEKTCSDDKQKGEFAGPMPEQPLTMPKTGEKRGRTRSSASKFGEKVLRSAKSGPIAAGASILVDELISPSQSVGAPTCDQVPDGCKEEKRQGMFRGMAPPRRGEYKVDPATGFVLPTRGPSFNIDPDQIPDRFEVRELMVYSGELQLIPFGKPGHFEMVPARNNMTEERYLQLFNEIVFSWYVVRLPR